MTGLDYLGRRLREILFVFHIALDLAYGLLVSGNLHFLVQIHLLGGLLAVEFKYLAAFFRHLGLYAQGAEFLEYPYSVGIPCRLGESVERLDVEVYPIQGGSLHAGNLDGLEVNVGYTDKAGLEFVP